MGAIARIEEINFPTALKPGDLITGNIVLKNVGDETTSEEAGYFGVLIKTLWDGKEYPLFTYSNTAPGETFTFDYHQYYPVGTMPDGDAAMEVVGRIWLGLDGVWRVDDVKSWIITSGEAPPPPTPAVSLLPPIASAIAGALAVIWGLSPG